jgi:hypothetical protein
MLLYSNIYYPAHQMSPENWSPIPINNQPIKKSQSQFTSSIHLLFFSRVSLHLSHGGFLPTKEFVCSFTILHSRSPVCLFSTKELVVVVKYIERGDKVTKRFNHFSILFSSVNCCLLFHVAEIREIFPVFWVLCFCSDYAFTSGYVLNEPLLDNFIVFCNLCSIWLCNLFPFLPLWICSIWFCN